jgi:hypothetical protein
MEPLMKHKITLLFLAMALLSGPAFAERGNKAFSSNLKWAGKNAEIAIHPVHHSNAYARKNQPYGRNDRYDRYDRRDRYDRKYKRHDKRRNGYTTDYGRLMYYTPDQFARWYADTAVGQAGENRRSGCWFDNGKGRWSSNWNDHYRHGLKQRRETSIREVETRKQELRECRSYASRW